MSLRTRQLVPEWMDSPDVNVGELHDALRFIRKINTRLRYNRVVVNEVLREVDATVPLRVLDIATGSADLPQAIRAAHPNASVVGLDNHPATLAFARSVVSDPDITLVQGDALELPFEDKSFDRVTCTLFLHHLPEELIVKSLAEMNRVCRGKVVVADLIRSRRALAWITLFTLGSSAMIRHDSRASVRHALTIPEMTTLAARAELKDYTIRRTFGHRMLLHW